MKRKILLVLLSSLLAQAQAGQDSPTLARITERGSITIGVRGQSAPFSYINEGQPKGYVVDLCRSIVAELEHDRRISIPTIRYVEVTAKNRLEKVAKGEIDMECGSTTITSARLKQVEFSNMTFVTGLKALILTRNYTVTRNVLETLEHGQIAVVDGTTAETVLNWWKPEISKSLIRVKDYAAGVAAVASGQAYAMVGDEILIESAVAESKNPRMFAYGAVGYSVEPYGIALPKGDPEFVAAINSALAKVYKAGQAEKMLSSWLAPKNLKINSLTRDAIARPGRNVSNPL